MLSDILDVLREHGWSETGPGHDPARWLKDHIAWLDERVSEAWRDAERASAGKTAAEEKRASAEYARDEARRELRDLRESIERTKRSP